MLSAVLVLFGIISYKDIGVDRYPTVEFPMISVTTILPGATPEIVDSSVTNLIESVVNSAPGIDHIQSNSSPGISAINIASRLGIKVPEEISIIGFTNGLLSMNSNPPLTTISQHGKDIGKVATQKLINRLKNKNLEYSTTVIETTLIKRGTTIN